MTTPAVADLLQTLLVGADTIGQLNTPADLHQHDRYTFITTDMVTGRIVDEVTGVGQVQFGKQLDDAGAASCAFNFTPTFDDVDRADRLRAATLPGRTALYILDEGQIAWGGPIWTRRADLSSGVVKLGCGDFFSYLTRRVLRALAGQLNVKFTDTDDADIIRAWVGLVNAVGLVLDPADSGNASDQTNWNYEYAFVGDLMQNLAATENGPDVYCDVVGDIDTARRVVRIGTPRLGRTVDLSQLVFDDKTLQTPSWEEDASSTAAMQWTPGAGSEVDQLFASATSPRLLADGWPPLDAVSQVYDKVTNLRTLQGHAAADLAAHAGVIVDLGRTGTVTGHRPIDVLPGDEAEVVVTSPWLPNVVGRGLDGRTIRGVDIVTRVTGFNATVPDNGGDETISPTFGELVVV